MATSLLVKSAIRKTRMAWLRENSRLWHSPKYNLEKLKNIIQYIIKLLREKKLIKW